MIYNDIINDIMMSLMSILAHFVYFPSPYGKRRTRYSLFEYVHTSLNVILRHVLNCLHKRLNVPVWFINNISRQIVWL